jgi:TPR repeat protein
MLDPVQAVALLEAAWRSGITTAAFELGTLYEHGVGGENARSSLRPDNVRASFWYQQAAERRTWRYRRSTLARVLAAEGRMQEVADAYEHVLEGRW